MDEDIKKFLIKCGIACGIAFLFLLALALIILYVIDECYFGGCYAL